MNFVLVPTQTTEGEHVTSAQTISGKTDFFVRIVEWPAWSPDDSYLEFFLLGYIKERGKETPNCPQMKIKK